MIESIYSIQYSALPEAILQSELQRISRLNPTVILHTLHRSRNRGIEKLLAPFPNHPVSTTVGYWTEEDLNTTGHPLKGRQALRLKSGLFYSLAPEAIRFQVEKSLKNMNRSKIDFLWIEDPDLLLTVESDPNRLAPHFEQCAQELETLRALGKVGAFGWIVRTPKILECLRDFPQLIPDRLIVPLNPFETSLFEDLRILAESGRKIWIDRGFSAVIGERLLPLVRSPRLHAPENAGKAPSSNSLFQKFQSTLESCLALENDGDGWANQLLENWAQIPDRERWEALKSDQLFPALESRKQWDHAHAELLSQYDRLFLEITEYFVAIESEFLNRWEARWPEEAKERSTRDRLLSFYHSIPGVNGVLLESETLLDQNWPEERFGSNRTEKSSFQSISRELLFLGS